MARLSLGLASLLATAALGMPPPPAAAQASSPDSVTIVLGPEYADMPGWRFLAGSGWRSAWTAPVRLAVADLSRLGGGLTRFTRDTSGLPDMVIGWSADGRAWRVRPVNRLPEDPKAPPEVWNTIVGRFFQDLVSITHPAAPLAAAAVYRVVGLDVVAPEMVVMPHEGLPEPLRPMAGEAVWIERAARHDGGPAERFAQVITTDSLLARLRRDPATPIDLPRYLAARLTDILVGDRDRGPAAWQWGRPAGGGGWVAIAIRQEEAFLRPDGLDASLFRLFMPGIVTFATERPEVASLTLRAYDLDRPLLARLERPVWDSVAASLTARLSDAAIRRAVAVIPAGYQPVSDPILVDGLIARRNHLPRVVDQFFERITRYADIELSDAPEQVRLSRLTGGDLELAVAARGAEILRRRFRRQETDEVRLHLLGAGDTVRLDHMDRHGIGLRITAGGGQDLVERSGEGRAHRVVVYDRRAGVVVLPEGDVRVSPYDLGRLRLWPDSGPRPPHLDWGVSRSPVLALDITSDYGFLFGGGMQWKWYGFGQPTYRQRFRASVEYATRPAGFRTRVDYERRNVFRNVHVSLAAKSTRLDVVRFFGYGNDTPTSGDLDDYRTVNREHSLRALVGISRTPSLEVRVGPAIYSGRTDTTGAGVIGTTDPYGGGQFTMAGLEASFNYTPDRPRFMGGLGVEVTARGEFFPELIDVDRGAFGGVSGETRLTWVPADGSRWALASRVGGTVLTGNVPYTRAARIGGGSSLRGFDTGRFTGDQGSLYFGLEGRARLVTIRVGLVPSDIGTFVFWDAGRVWATGESSSTLHQGSGIGFWIAPALSWMPGLGGLVGRVHYAWAGERKTINFGTGFQF